MILRVGQRVRIKDGYQTDSIWNSYEMNYCVGLVGKVVYQSEERKNKYFVEMYVPDGCCGGAHIGIMPKEIRGWWFHDYILEPISEQLMLFEV